MYFGIKTKDGKTQEWEMDNPGNDFMTGSKDTYTFKLKDENLKLMIYKICGLEKENIQHSQMLISQKT